MNEALELSYPIFIKDQNGYIYKFDSYDQIICELETWFVEDEIRAVWDLKGRKHILRVKDSRTEEYELLKDSKDPDLEGLIQALMNYAPGRYSKYPFSLDEPCKDPVVLFDKIENHYEYYRWSSRVKRKIGSWFGIKYESGPRQGGGRVRDLQRIQFYS